jgi:hypothetical protein
MTNTTRISARVDGTVVIEHEEMVGTWTMTPHEARNVAAALTEMADEAEMHRFGGSGSRN